MQQRFRDHTELQKDCFQIGYQATVFTGQEQEVYFLHNKPAKATIFVGDTADLFNVIGKQQRSNNGK